MQKASSITQNNASVQLRPYPHVLFAPGKDMVPSSIDVS